MRLLALDLSSKTGWALFVDGKLVEHGVRTVEIPDFHIHKEPSKHPAYPWNIIDAADKMADIVIELGITHSPDFLVIENTVKGRSRDSQRWLEFLHAAVLKRIRNVHPFAYQDPSQWRSILAQRLTKEDKKNNQAVAKAAKLGVSKKSLGVKGRVGKKHLSVRFANERYGLNLKLSQNDQADAICQGTAWLESHVGNSI